MNGDARVKCALALNVLPSFMKRPMLKDESFVNLINKRCSFRINANQSVTTLKHCPEPRKLILGRTRSRQSSCDSCSSFICASSSATRKGNTI